MNVDAAIEFFAAPARPPLSRFVEMFWGTRGRGPYHRSRVLPNGALQLMLNFGPPHHVVGIGERRVDHEHHHAWIAGLQELPLSIASPEVTDIFAVRFKPGGAHAFFGGPIDALSNEVVPADAWFGRAADELHERVGAAGGQRAGQVNAAEDWLLGRLAPREPAQGLVERAASALARLEPGTSVAGTCEQLGLSNKHLIDLFRRHVGLAPKTYARIRRFHAALGSLAVGEPRADLAARLGYSDQAHFGHDFKRLAGVTPGEFVARRGIDNESLILG